MNPKLENQILGIANEHVQGIYTDTLTRFSYVNGGADDFLRFIENPLYTGFAQEILLIRRLLARQKGITQGRHLIDLGPGNGVKALELMQAANFSSYTAVDISTHMLEIARKTHKKVTGVSRAYREMDFSDPGNLQKILHESRQIFLTLLGNTLTNESNIKSYLRRWRTALHNIDAYFLIGLETNDNNDPEQIEAEYNTAENRQLTFRPLEKIGACSSDGVINIQFNRKNQRVEETFTFTSDKWVKVNDQTVLFHKGATVILSITEKPSLRKITEMISKSGWEIVDQENEGNQRLTIIRPCTSPLTHPVL